jgi:hypothetical protein
VESAKQQLSELLADLVSKLDQCQQVGQAWVAVAVEILK